MNSYDNTPNQTDRSRLDYKPRAYMPAPREPTSELERCLRSRAFPDHPLAAVDHQQARNFLSALQHEDVLRAENIVAHYLRNDGSSNPATTFMHGMMWGNVPYFTTALNLTGVALVDAPKPVQQRVLDVVRRSFDELTSWRVEYIGLRRGVDPADVPAQVVRSIDAPWLYLGVVDPEQKEHEIETIVNTLMELAPTKHVLHKQEHRNLNHYGLAPQLVAVSSERMPAELADHYFELLERAVPGIAGTAPRGLLPTKYVPGGKPYSHGQKPAQSALIETSA
jgi:hypothetical protein